jgi:cytoskeletal protein CcmA (bactofilin family)
MGLLGRKRSGHGAPGYSVIDDRLTIHGEIETDGTVRIDGRVEGAVHRAASIIIGAGGGVVGDIEAGEVVVAGTVQGNVHATGRIEVEPGASVHGEIRANAMLLREGAIIHGKVSIGAAPPAVDSSTAGRRLELTPSPPGRARV